MPGSTKRLGIGISSYFEMCGLAPSRVLASLNYGAGGWETATVRVLPTNKVQVVTGTAPHGQGHETCWSMIAAEKLGVPPEDIEVLHSDTAISPIGLDSYGSRSLAVGGVAIDMACDRVIDKARTIAAHQLECAEEDLDFAAGEFTVRGTPDKSTPLAAIAFAAFTAHDLPDGLEPNLEASVTYDPPNFSWPFGTHMCVVEVDTETGAVDVLKYVAVDDCGVQINPLIVNGQVHGGVVQGLAQALFEEAVYDRRRQPQDEHADRVPGAGGLGRAGHHDRPHRHALAHQRHGGQGHRRGRHHRRRARRHQRRRRRPLGPRRDRRPHARFTPQRVEGHPGRDRRYAVIPAKFEYKRASSAEEAISLVGEHGDEAKFLAGGHSLLPLMKLRLASPAVLVDIGRLRDLSYIRDAGDHLAIGALTRHRDIETSDVVKEHAPLLAHATSHVGDPQVRHRGTIGGSLAHADPAADLPATTLALGATYVAQGPGGTREIAAADFYEGFLESALAPDELLTEIRVPKMGGAGWGFQKFNRRAQDWAIVGVAAWRRNGDSGVALVNMGSTPVLASAVSAALAGGASVGDAAEQAAADAEPQADLNASVEFRVHLAKVLVRRALEDASA